MRTIFFSALLLTTMEAFAQSPSAEPRKVGYVDTDYVLSRMPEFQLAQQKVQETRAQMANEMQAKQKQLQTEYDQYMANAEGMADSLREQTEQRLLALDAEVQQFPAEAQKAMENAKQLYLATAYLKVGNAVNAVAQQNNLSLVLPLRIGNIDFLFYADPALDYSEKVLEELGIPKEAVPADKK